jgi:hypothetical protein
MRAIYVVHRFQDVHHFWNLIKVHNIKFFTFIKDTPTLLLLELDLLDFDENLHPDSGFQEEFNGAKLFPNLVRCDR